MGSVSGSPFPAMNPRALILPMTAAFSAVLLCFAAAPSPDREPAAVTPGTAGSPPSDAVVLFDGKDLSAWKSDDGTEPQWKVEGGHMEVRGKSIMTRQQFGAIQLHLEWATPAEVKGEGQGRGNSGVYFQGRYEIQVLDSYQNKTYFNGQAASFYGHHAPLVNASRKPGEWQSYDIVFHPPQPGADGKVVAGSFTVIHNGVLVQDHIPIQGDASVAAKFSGATPTGPLLLQDHGNPVRYRNIWVRKLD